VSDQAAGQTPGGSEGSGHALDAVTDEVLPALIARLRASRLGELEVRTADWRVRLRRDGRGPTSRPAIGGAGGGAGEGADQLVGSIARSPAVGYFTPAPDLAIGQPVQAGDLLGSIDVLGISQEVIAPSDGIISRVLAEDGQAVEYGQGLADIDALELELELTSGVPAVDDR
jgi:acetyl-CoA carboxylase biotin carboxyl carrier protein